MKNCEFCGKINRIARKLLIYVLNTYSYFFARKWAQPFSHLLLSISLRGRGYENCCSPWITGEEHFVDLLSKFDPKLCVDIGANKGQYSDLLLKKTASNVIAFEPLPTPFRELKNLEKIYKERFASYNFGVGAKDNDTLPMFYSDEKSELATFSAESNCVSYVRSANSTTINLPLVSLDFFFRENYLDPLAEIDFLKIDTEGFEMEVLLGAKETLSLRKPKFIQMEFNWHQLYRGHTLYAFSKILSNYMLFQILPFNNGLVRRDPERPDTNIYRYSNFVFVRNDIDFQG